MSLVNLPEEILIIIIRQLDLRSIINLYNSCMYLRRIVSMHGVVRECCLSLNTLATVQSLKLDFFNIVSGHLLELNMCGVHDLYKTSLLPAVRKMKSLQTLNVAHTRISMLDFLDIYELCPTIINITINFYFMKPISWELITRFQKIFLKIKNVHFVGCNFGLLESGLSQHILQKARLNNLRFTVVSLELTSFHRYEEAKNMFYKCNYFSLFWKDCMFHGHSCATRHMLDSEHFEYLVITAVDASNFTVYASQIFKNFLFQKLGIVAECTANAANKPLPRNFAMMAWDKNTTSFDENFFGKLLQLVNKFFPCNYLPVETKPSSDWYCITPTFHNIYNSENHEPMFKRRRVVPPNAILNYDELFQENQTVQLNLSFNNQFRNPVALPSNNNYLKKLTYLSLTGSVLYSMTFFNVLFRCCAKLVTLNVEAPFISSCAAAISRSLPLTQSVKNLRLVDKRINFKTLLSSFSQCKTLEIVYILDVSDGCNEIADPSTMFEKCDNLYYMLISVSNNKLNNVKTIFNKAKSRSRKHHLNIDFFSGTSIFNYPFLSVFQLNPIRQ